MMSKLRIAFAVGMVGALAACHSGVKLDENAPDAYKSRYFHADALHNQVRLEVALHQFDPKQYPEPGSQEIATAEQAAIEVRDSDEDDQFIDNVGLFVVDLADVDRDLSFQRWQDSAGSQGVEPRKEPNLSYRLLRWSYPAFRVMFPNLLVRSDDLARAMVDVAVQATAQRQSLVFENRDINALAHGRSS